MLRPRVVVAATLLLGLGGVASAKEDPLKGLDEDITKAMRDWQVPGLAIAIVKDDAVVLAKGYGVRKLGEASPVNERTLFAIGSVSKSFTAAALGMLVDEGKMKWDDPVIKHLPGFLLKDPFVTREITLRDLLSHRTGLGRLELVWYGSPASREDVLRRMRYAKLGSGFRSGFGYQNVMYLAAGQTIPTVTGKSWDEFVSQRIFKPLGMTSTNTSIKAFGKADNVATPQEKSEDKVKVIPWRNIDNIGPAGSINSNVVDMAQWLRLQLGEGTYNKQRLLSSGAIKEMHMPQTVMRNEGTTAKLFPDTHFMAYGLGWMLQDYRGQKIVQHGGGIDGMISLVAMIPEKKLGVVLLTNRDGQQLTTALAFRIFDAYLGAPPRDWSAELHKTIKGLEDLQKDVKKKQEKERLQGTKPALALDQYAGTYRDDLYGEIKIVKEKDKLVLHFGPSFIGDLEHWNYDTFRITWRAGRFPKGFVTFRLTPKAKVEDLKFEITGMGDWVAERADEKDATPAIILSKEELRKFIGKYESKTPPLEVSIEMVGDQLKGVSGGLPTVTLMPLKPTRFKLSGLPVDVFLEFELAGGKVKSVTLEQKPVTITLVPKK
ncbi:MAG: serine hydrolase [Planctomycetes bacterium]|nr:serine hydrolase [Planctomycetota bacterium]